MIPPFEKRPGWLKSRGYLHITPKIDIFKRYVEIMTKVRNEEFVGKHGFFPLIHSIIKERKYKKHPDDSKARAHSHIIEGNHKKSEKQRPLHYATHIDSMIFGYYAELILNLYEKELENYQGLTDCVTAYRKIEIENNTGIEPSIRIPGKSTIHFAFEAFEEIKKRSDNGCVVLMFDIKSFFSNLNHDKLKKAWCKLFNLTRLNAAHFNVFNAATNFRYIMRDDLRVRPGNKGRRSGFNEKKLAHIRKTKGIEAYFESVEDFRTALANKELVVYKNPFVKNRVPVGIPQGLPISAVLANLYLLEFDKLVLKNVVNELDRFYRRYSDDILIICKPDQAEHIEDFIESAIKESDLKISSEKTEKYLFKYFQVSPRKKKLTSILLSKKSSSIGKPLTYLGFEFYGDKILIKSANLAKFYRRMIISVKMKAKRAIKINGSSNAGNPVIFRGRLKRKYSMLNLEKIKQFRKRKKLVKNDDGLYSIQTEDVEGKHSTNYFSYVNRASSIMDESSIKAQIRNHRRIFNSAIAKHLKKSIEHK